MPLVFIFSDKVHSAITHGGVENILEGFRSFGNLGDTSKADVCEAIRTTIDECLQFLRKGYEIKR